MARRSFEFFQSSSDLPIGRSNETMLPRGTNRVESGAKNSHNYRITVATSHRKEKARCACVADKISEIEAMPMLNSRPISIAVMSEPDSTRGAEPGWCHEEALFHSNGRWASPMKIEKIRMSA